MPKLSPSAIEKNKGRIEEAAKKLFIKQGFHGSYRSAAGFALFRRKRATKKRPDAEHIEEICGNSVDGCAHRLDAAGNGGELAMVLSDAIVWMKKLNYKCSWVRV